jgi:trehalose 6-phosphate phosphatase
LGREKMRQLFKHWQNLSSQLQKKRIILFLDYDGTLTPIVKSAEKAIIPKETKSLLCDLCAYVKLAVISGRALSDLKKMVGVKGIIYSGNHGLEIEGPKLKFSAPVSSGYKRFLRTLKARLEKRLAGIKGIILEDKGLSLSLHYRLVDKKLVPKVQTIFHETTISPALKNRVKIRPGKRVWEIRPPIQWDKGKIVLWLLAREKFALGEGPLLPIYAGDDTTDEDAFRALRNKGITIFVGRPKKSSAQYYLNNSKEVAEFLKRTLSLQKIKS